MAAQASQDVITFALNGERMDVRPGDFDVTTTLNAFIRRQTRYKGTKLACAQGGCGACTVDLARMENGHVVHMSVNSCLRPLALMDGWAVTTTEGLGDSKNGFHPIQERIAHFNASQCGFCTPGMVMTLYSALKEKPERSMEDLESRMDGNICRCTGFRPILDAIKSFAVDSNTQNMVNKDIPFTHGPYNTTNDPKFPDFLNTVSRFRPIKFSDPLSRTWVRPCSLQEALQYASTLPANQTKFVHANTSVGYYREENETVRNYIDISNLAELVQTSIDQEKGLTIGAGNTITSFISALRATQASNGAGNPNKVKHLTALANHAYRVAGTHVRNIASIGGNLMISKKKGFVSDLATILLGSKATVTLVTDSKGTLENKNQTLEEFLSTPQLEANQMLLSVTIPWTNESTHFATYKAAPRPQQAVATINSAFWFDVDRNSGKVEDVCLSFGGVMNQDAPGSHAIRAKRAEQAIKGQNIREKKTIEAAMEALKQDFRSHAGERDNAGGDEKYRERVVSGFLYKNFISVLGEIGPNGGDIKIDTRVVSATVDPAERREVSRATQKFADVEEKGKKTGLVGKAIPHISAKIQAAGEAVYTDDIGEVEGTLYCAVVQAKHGRKILKGIDTTKALQLPGVVAVIDARDIQGKNNCSGLGGEIEAMTEIGKLVQYHGQPIAGVIARSEIIARRGAALVDSTYEDVPGNKKPVVSIDEALREGGEFITPIRNEFKIGDADKEDAAELQAGEHRASGTIYIGGQHHFYMETQCAYIIPDEDETFTAYMPNQWPEIANMAICGILGISANRVRIVNRRVGGAFGGKASHTIIIAAIAAVASKKLNAPVRIALDRTEDFRICGGREETKAEYNVKFDKDGKIKSLRMDGYINAGFVADLSFFTSNAFAQNLTQTYQIDNLKSNCTLLRTNLPNRTTMRGPGETQASYTIEHVIANIAHVLNKPTNEIREKNFLQAGDKLPNGKQIEGYALPEVWNKCKEMSDFERRAAEVEVFNRDNRWKKRGIEMSTVKYEVNVMRKEALVNIYGDGSIIVNHTGCEMGQGMNTKVSQVVEYELSKIGCKIGMDKIRFEDNRSEVMPNGMVTGGSTGSEAVAEAARRAAEILTGRLSPIRAILIAKALKEKVVEAATNILPGGTTEAKTEIPSAAPEPPQTDDAVAWKDLCMAAKMMNINLQAQGIWEGAGKSELAYHIFGAAASEVEVDILTGEVTTRRVDIAYDNGRSLNPAIDIGQCEGAFLMGLGHWLRETVVHGSEGQHDSSNVFKYHPPCGKDVPQIWNVELIERDWERGIMSSKASGEPPLVLATSVALAVRNAVGSARKDAGNNDFFILEAPITPEVIQEACGTKDSELRF